MLSAFQAWGREGNRDNCHLKGAVAVQRKYSKEVSSAGCSKEKDWVGRGRVRLTGELVNDRCSVWESGVLVKVSETRVVIYSVCHDIQSRLD